MKIKRSNAAIAMCLMAMFVAGCSSKRQGVFQGYIEGEFVYVASPLGGSLTNLAVARGTQVKSGQLLFELEHESELASVREASQRACFN